MSKPTENEIRNQKLYHVPGSTDFYKVKLNAIFINNHNTLHHEVFKSIASILIRRYGDLKVTKDLIESVRSLSSLLELIYKDFPINPHRFITECCPNDNPDRRIDLVDLETNDKWEFEKSKKTKKNDSLTVYI